MSVIGICGRAGSGKDTAADYLCQKHGFVKVALADPLKRICRDVFDFSEEQLWGESKYRNTPDKRYPWKRSPHTFEQRTVRQVMRTDIRWVCTRCGGVGNAGAESSPTGLAEVGGLATCLEYLTPRYALQQLGTQWGRDCYPNVWVDYTIRIYERLQSGGVAYDQQRGLFTVSYLNDGICGMWPKINVVIPDVRFKNEINAIKKAGGKVIKIVRGAGLTGDAGAHQSEVELESIPLSEFTLAVDNTRDLENLYRQLDTLLL